jgi:hypothetical protein
MASAGRSQQAADDGVVDARPPGVALVAVLPNNQGTPGPYRRPSRAEFVTHLIATAEHAPQTRVLRRATPADAQLAYQAHQRRVPAAGMTTRQII